MKPFLLVAFSLMLSLLICGNAEDQPSTTIKTTTKEDSNVRTILVPICMVHLRKIKKRATPPALVGMTCECAVFPTNQPSKTDTPILAHKTINLTCSKEDEQKCASLCVALAQASKEQGPGIICDQLGHYDSLLVSLFSSSCGEDKWVYTNFTAPDPICCHDHKVADCTTLEEE